MEKLIETFRIEDGKPLCLTEHQRRVEESTRRLTGRRTVINLKDIHIPPQYEKGIVKCSVTYDERLCGVVFRSHLVQAGDLDAVIPVVVGHHVIVFPQKVSLPECRDGFLFE